MNGIKRGANAFALVLAVFSLASVLVFVGCKSGGGDGGGDEPGVSNPPVVVNPPNPTNPSGPTGILRVTINWPAPPVSTNILRGGGGTLLLPETEYIRIRAMENVTSPPPVTTVTVMKPVGCTGSAPELCTTTTPISVPANLSYNIDAIALKATPDPSPYRSPVLLTSGTAEGNPISVAPGTNSPVLIHLNNHASTGSNVASSVNFTVAAGSVLYAAVPNVGMTFTDWPADLVAARIDVFYIDPNQLTSIRNVGSPAVPGTCQLAFTGTGPSGSNLLSTRGTCASAPPFSGGDFQVAIPPPVAILARIDATKWLAPSVGAPSGTLLPPNDVSTVAVTTFDVLSSGTFTVGPPDMGNLDVIVD